MGVPVLPDNAPFTPAQRAWLNGFFAGVLSLETSCSKSESSEAALTAVRIRSAASIDQIVPGDAEEDVSLARSGPSDR